MATPLSKIAEIVDDGGGFALTESAWERLRSRREELLLPGLEVVSLSEFVAKAEMPEANPAHRTCILDQAKLLFENFYSHLPFKKQLYETAQPLERLGSLRERAESLSTLDFHSGMQSIFDGLKDAHTVYGLPAPYNDAVAFLPFSVRRVFDRKDDSGELREAFVVTRVMETTQSSGNRYEKVHDAFTVGVELVKWDGLDLRTSVKSANRSGGNEAAVLARGAALVTLRPLGHAPIPRPDEEIVTVEYLPEGASESRSMCFRWGVATGIGVDKGLPGGAFSKSPTHSMMNSAEKALWCPYQMQDERAPQTPDDSTVLSTLRAQFNFQHSGGIGRPGFVQPEDLVDPHELDKKPEERKKFGYVRILNFDTVPTSDAEFRRILQLLNEVAPDGLIVDLRSNPGGDIVSAENMLQMLTAEPVVPARFHLANTPGIRTILKRVRSSIASPAENAQFLSWKDDASAEDAFLTVGQPLSNTAAERMKGQAYHGPAALLIDGFTYSAADIFAGGFADHEVGSIVGVDANTGGGGGSVWKHDDLVEMVPHSEQFPIQRLPAGVTMRVAGLRSSRVRVHEGTFIEDIGVAASRRYSLTEADVLGNVGGLFRFICGEVLSGQTVHRLEIDSAELGTGPDGMLAATISVSTANIDTLQLSLFSNGDRVASLHQDVTASSLPGMTVAFNDSPNDELNVLMEGFVAGGDGKPRLVASAGQHLREATGTPAFIDPTQATNTPDS